MPTGSSSESKLLRLAILHHELAARGYGLGEITLTLDLLPCVWFGVVWVGLAPTLILGMTPTFVLFCSGSGSFQFLVWFEDCKGLEPTRHLFG